MPKKVYLQLQMQALELKITDFWAFLALPAGFLDGWFLVRSAIIDYQASMSESA